VANGEDVIYASGVDPEDAAVLRLFALKNHMTFAQLMHILREICEEKTDIDSLLTGKVAEVRPEFAAFDQMISEYLERNVPEEYRKVPVLRRWFGRITRPVTRAEVQEIRRRLKQEGRLE